MTRPPYLNRLPFYIVAAFTLVCACAGGSSRFDEPLLIVARLAVVCALIALILVPAAPHRARIAPLHVLLVAFTVATALQLIPLPPALWQQLPGHSRFIEAAAAAGIAQPWRPISVAPDLTVNSLMALLPAFAVMLGYAKSGPTRHVDYAWLVCLVAGANVVVGVFQVAGGPQSAFYYYDHMARGIVSGMFSNRNHFAAYLAVVLPLLVAQTVLMMRGNSGSALPVVGGASILLLLMVLLSGSRSGTAVFAASALLSALVFRRSFGAPKRSTLLIAGGVAVITAGTIALAYDLNRTASLARFQTLSTAELRVRTLPVVWRMVQDFFPFGTGFGTFDPVFRIYEPDALLKPSYFNNAHNDWLELLLTGGLPGVLVLVGFAFWYVRAAWCAFRTSRGDPARLVIARAAAIGIICIGASSLTDYPLRSASFSILMTIVCCLLNEATEVTRDTHVGSQRARPTAHDVTVASPNPLD